MQDAILRRFERAGVGKRDLHGRTFSHLTGNNAKPDSVLRPFLRKM